MMMNTIKDKEEEERKLEIKEARKAFKEKGFYGFFLEPMFDYWKKHPFKSIGVFMLWFSIYYIVFSGFQGINYTFIFCDSETNEGFDGRILEIYPKWIEYNNERNLACRAENDFGFNNLELNSGNNNYMCTEKPEFSCDYNFEEYKKQGFVSNFKYTFSSWWKVIIKE